MPFFSAPEGSASIRSRWMKARCSGRGPAVVLLHGYGETGDMWVPLAKDLARDHTVVVPDLRGMGLSAKPADGYDKKTQAGAFSMRSRSSEPRSSPTTSATKRSARAFPSIRFVIGMVSLIFQVSASPRRVSRNERDWQSRSSAASRFLRPTNHIDRGGSDSS
jgi:hypothetical protein